MASIYILIVYRKEKNSRDSQILSGSHRLTIPCGHRQVAGECRWQESGKEVSRGCWIGLEGFKALMLCRGLGGVEKMGFCVGFL